MWKLWTIEWDSEKILYVSQSLSKYIMSFSCMYGCVQQTFLKALVAGTLLEALEGIDVEMKFRFLDSLHILEMTG